MSDTYASFRTQVSDWLDVDDVTSAQLDQIIQMGEKWVNRKLRVKAMEEDLTQTISSVGDATQPASYIGGLNFYINTSPTRPLQKKSEEWLFKNYANRASGIPSFIAEKKNLFLFDKLPSAGEILKGTYYKKPDSLPGTGTINSVFTEHEDVYLFAALANAEMFLGRDQRLIWMQKAIDAINEANKEDQRRRFSGGPLAVTPG